MARAIENDGVTQDERNEKIMIAARIQAADVDSKVAESLEA